MSSFSGYRKADLSSLLKKIGVHTVSKDTKKIMVEKLDNFVAKNPDQIPLVNKILEEIGANEADEEEVTVVEEAVADVKEENNNDNGEEGEEEEEEEEEEDDEEEEEDEDDEEDDKDYNAPPPLNLKETIIDPILAKSEVAIDKFYEFTDSVGITYLDTTERLRDQLSSTVTLNFLEILVEFLFYLYNFTSVVPLNKNKFIHQFFHDNIPYLAESTFPSIEITSLFQYKAIATGITWILFAIVVPSITSYFVNFTSRVIEVEEDEYLFRVYSFDPFIFAIVKVLTYYLVGQSTLIDLSTQEYFFSGLQNRLLVHLGLYHTFASTLGSLPYVLGGVNVLIALYSQFEEY
ncbi:hypothetical protein PVL30_005477 [Lodderomyces elongisporus]|uniref:Uncharacterized protein n=1 Tax=Lodderomyces elongisporus (strain ATCC 11503 / CBS 2605 / JCM 1781 / NBRC 1676 / NRRL YB-4239) TaxID=379508 RepID=A5E557_LODEL|nr:uncharacterized protein PVL30_005477 [Lodderomyces elongisporus]EDK46565.1 hypothetical protein LELG_04746 [Lodderomyces elongisporus NRRL YB-4239]WLF81678.1 hypothetical protein PVL30_005477 [Lodderomyces elongisporus]